MDFIAHNLSLSSSSPPDMAEILLKRRKISAIELSNPSERKNTYKNENIVSVKYGAKWLFPQRPYQ